MRVHMCASVSAVLLQEFFFNPINSCDGSVPPEHQEAAQPLIEVVPNAPDWQETVALPSEKLFGELSPRPILPLCYWEALRPQGLWGLERSPLLANQKGLGPDLHKLPPHAPQTSHPCTLSTRQGPRGSTTAEDSCTWGSRARQPSLTAASADPHDVLAGIRVPARAADSIGRATPRDGAGRSATRSKAER